MDAPWGEVVAELEVDPERSAIHAEGWQSWSPTTTYRLGGPQARPVRPEIWTQGYGGTRSRPPGGAVLQGEGLVVVDPGTGADVVAFGARSADDEVPVIRIEQVGSATARVTADGPVHVVETPAGMEVAKASFADGFAARSGVGAIRPAPTIWCSWYQYYSDVTEADMDENLSAIAALDLPVDVVQLDDGYQRQVGDWLTLSGRFRSLPAMVERIRATGRRAGIWIAPFLAAARSDLAADHPGWLVRGSDGSPIVAIEGWGSQPMHVLDPTHPGVRDHLASVFAWFATVGIDLFKLDFLFAASLDGHRHDGQLTSVQAYRSGLAHLRSAAGPDAYLLGCGAPLLPSVGAVDGMRISADTAPGWPAEQGDLSMPGGSSAELSIPARAYQHGRYWVNDPDCLLLRPGVDHRERRARLVGRYGGLRGSSDRIASLDGWGLETTVELLTDVPPPTPFSLASLP